jgi:ketosteroid isomerase-like protein
VKVIRTLALVTIQIALILAAASLIAVGAANGNGQQEPGNRGSVEQELKDIDQHWLRAATTHDTDYLQQLFAAGMFEVQKGGLTVTGEQMVKYLGVPTRHIQIDIDQVEVRGLYGDTAILTDRTTQDGVTPDGRKVTGLYTVVRILRKMDGQWHGVGAAMVPLKASTSANRPSDVPNTEPTKIVSGPVEQELISLDHKWVDAATKGDTKFLKSLFGDRVFEVQPDGHIATGAEMLKEIATRKPGQVEGFCDQIQVRGVYGDTAILTDRRVRKGTAADGRDVSGQWRVTRVLVKQGGRWRAVAAAMTPIE